MYDTAGLEVRQRLGPWIRDLYYDAAGRITAFKHLDAATGTATAQARALDQQFSYDAADRLVRVSTARSTWTATYDANGNRTSTSEGTTVSNVALAPDSNRLQRIDSPERIFFHDAAGNLTGDSSKYTARYDAAGRLAWAHNGTVAVSMDYDGAGLRVRRVESSGAASTLMFVHDAAGRLLGEYDVNGMPLREYVWLGDMPLAMLSTEAAGPSNPTLYFIHTDHLGTPRALIDRTGALRWTWLSEPFGNTPPDSNPIGLGAVNLPMRMPGQYADDVLGLFYNQQRYYDASVGRYTQSDPIGLAGGINTYAYVGGNPVSYTDPSGLDNPGMGPYGPGPNRGDGSSGPVQVGGAVGDFLLNYQKMREANTIGGDKYFHCMANCQATRRGPAGESTACTISDVREWTDQNIKGDPASASAADQAANAVGRSGALSSSQSCSAVCSGFRPNGLPSRF